MDHDYFTIQGEAAGERAVRMVLSGEFDFGASGDLRAALLDLVTGGEWATIVVDLASVDFIDSEALAALLDGRSAAHDAGIAFRAVKSHGVVRRVLSVTGTLAMLDPPGTS